MALTKKEKKAVVRKRMAKQSRKQLQKKGLFGKKV
jgi:hypothetical protein